ncbi:zinc finger, CCHC-type containing protein [Tanacetum coccineum]
MADYVKDMTTKFGKLDKFEGSDFRHWQKKMHFLFTTFKVAYVLSTPRTEFVEEETLEQTRKRCKWDNDDYICRGHILNSMSDSLFDVYQNVESAKELWDQLKAKYMAKYTSSKKFLVSNFHNYRMVDSRSVMEQYHELLQILRQYTQHGLFMDESISMYSILDKLPPSWKDFKHMLKHKDELSLVQLGSHFRIEETLRMKESGKGKCKDIAGSSSVNMDDEIAWWIDSGATCHACKDRCWFDTFHPVEDESVLHMDDESTKPILGRGNVVIKFSSGKTITLFNVVYYNNGMFMLNLNKVPSSINSVYMAYSLVVDSKLWHARLGHKGIDCIFIGYAEHSKAYRFYVIEPNDFVSVNSIIESRDAIFNKNILFSIPRPKDIVYSSNGTQGGDLPVEGSRDEIASQYYYCYSIEEDPKTFDEAMKSRDVAFWKEAVDDEIGSIIENNTWVLFDLPLGCKPLGCKWILKYKMKVDVARISTIRLFIALTATHNLVIHQMDVKTTFLNGDLEEGVYMKQSEGFVMTGNEHKVCKLIKSLYGLKQAPKQWHHKFNEVVLSNEFVVNQSDKCVYCKFDESGKGFIICLYVDDMFIFGTDHNQVDKTKEFLSSNFSMKDTGEADVILRIRIKRENKGLAITQSHYIEKILKKFNCEGCGRVSTPMEAGYSDASWITNNDDHTSTTGWVFLLGGGAISWAFKKQTCMTDSTMESELVALTAAGNEAEWLRSLIYEILLWPKPISPIFMHCDSAATLAKGQIYNGKSRHLDTQFPYNTTLEAEFNKESLQLKIGAHCIILRCKTKRTTYVSMECRRFKKLGLRFLYAHEGYGHKAL